MSDEFRIRAARPDDVDLVFEFVRQLAIYDKLEHKFQATPSDIREMLFGGRPAAEAILAFVGDTPVGFAVFYTTVSTFAGKAGLYVEDLFVHPDYRKRGYGRALFSYIARVGVRRGYDRMSWSVLDWNIPSIAFYEGLGARHVEDWLVYRLPEDNMIALSQMRGE